MKKKVDEVIKICKMLNIVWLFFLVSFQTLQETDLWQTLMTVKYRYVNDVYIPTFNPQIQAFHNKEVVIKGYIYPLEEAPQHSFFMLSYYPASSCFFCGAAGPETVIEVNAIKPVKYSLKPIKLKGILKLNADDPQRLFYILNKAEQIP
ncbi:MAG: hypothetical protein NZ551_09835 [Microscillaceae bacterium]|nr:hypothetical protein [Microscillaceae bacterium]MDW8461497.1 hypothetical protein [Cytophagales bacterium]